MKVAVYKKHPITKITTRKEFEVLAFKKWLIVVSPDGDLETYHHSNCCMIDSSADNKRRKKMKKENKEEKERKRKKAKEDKEKTISKHKSTALYTCNVQGCNNKAGCRGGVCVRHGEAGVYKHE